MLELVLVVAVKLCSFSCLGGGRSWENWHCVNLISASYVVLTTSEDLAGVRLDTSDRENTASCIQTTLFGPDQQNQTSQCTHPPLEHTLHSNVEYGEEDPRAYC